MKESIIHIQNLTKRFGQTEALQNVSLTVRKGEVFGLIGSSGAGKSTLMRCLTFLELPTEGEIYLTGERLTPRNAILLRRRMGMVFQHFHLFSSRTVLENIAYPLEIEGIEKRQRNERAQELVELVGLVGKEQSYPAELSGGQKQRVAIARALANHPTLLLCDEATSALDPVTTQAILDLLAEINRKLGLTILLITHEMEVVRRLCTRVAVLEHGEIVEQGSSVELFSHPRHPTTKRFLQRLSHEIPPALAARGDLYRLFFTGKSAGEPIISRLIKEHNLDVNILLGGIDLLRTETVGSLVIALQGSEEERLKACQFLDSHKVGWERIE